MSNFEQHLSEDNFESLDDTPSDQNDPDIMKRTTRIRHKPKRYGDFVQLSSRKQRNNSNNTSSEDYDNDYAVSMEGCSQKPTALLGEGDVHGHDIFKFKSRHSKHNLQNIVRSATSATDSPMKTPKKNKTSLLKVSEATPKHVAKVMKKRIIREVESDSAESDFSGSSSDYVPENSEDEESLDSGADTEEEVEDDDEEQVSPKKSNKQKIVKSKSNQMTPRDSEFFVTPDNYFAMHSSKKITTSDHTLARLKNIDLSDNTKEAEAYVSKEHQSKILNLVHTYEQLFNKWIYVLSENFNIVLYGVGSKRSIIQRFQMQKLADMPCVVINGFFPSLTIKNVLETIVIDLLEITVLPSNVSDVVSLIDAQLSASDTQLFLLVHNIDGPMLRNSKAQSVLANLSHLKNVHTIASIDHINAPLLWDHSKLSKFKFTWWDITTFLPYTEETSYENSLMTQRSGALQLSSLKSVYQSLTTNAKGIFNIIIQYQLENQKQSHYQGLPFRDLYSKAREQFLVSSDLALRAQLTEFLDHKLAKIKRSYDGSENLIIPIESALLQQFLEQNSS